MHEVVTPCAGQRDSTPEAGACHDQQIEHGDRERQNGDEQMPRAGGVRRECDDQHGQHKADERRPRRPHLS